MGHGQKKLRGAHPIKLKLLNMLARRDVDVSLFILCALKTCSQNTEIEVSKVQTHNFDVSFPKISKTGDGTKQF